jgi:thiamine-phosphate pyrophosphorylase
MSPETLAKLRLYLVTDRAQTARRPLLAVVEAALLGGVRAVQLRERDLDTRELLELARALRDLTSRHDALLLVNDRIDVALVCGADGVHLPVNSFAAADARDLLGDKALIGVSTHSTDELASAARCADFAVFGPIFDTPSKRGLGDPLGIEPLRAACAAAALPIIAIGGVTVDTAAECRQAGASGVAVIRAVLADPDPQAASRKLLNPFS